MEQIKLECLNQELLPEVAQKIIDFGYDRAVWTFEGTLGAGKTTLIKTICEALEVIDLVNSPTFSIVNEYSTEDDATIYHFDFYRLNDEEEAMDIGYEEYVTSGALCLMEWPSKIPNLIPDEHLAINIDITGTDSRSITVIKK
ncbi:tRNA (adenosine(37)-N6)-threonylcarbamoyltransferase complex ATPase subunit type 1 TsaE [Algivirga pacifica]|uniref:tRNA threonylcarbamoyladenosine biosynthesis protein TsaE n=1 Tax=Algivirga pacifica TaxID=1162670 RepID=A0ABP9DC17_9BACT